MGGQRTVRAHGRCVQRHTRGSVTMAIDSIPCCRMQCIGRTPHFSPENNEVFCLGGSPGGTRAPTKHRWCFSSGAAPVAYTIPLHTSLLHA